MASKRLQLNLYCNHSYFIGIVARVLRILQVTEEKLVLSMKTSCSYHILFSFYSIMNLCIRFSFFGRITDICDGPVDNRLLNIVIRSSFIGERCIKLFNRLELFIDKSVRESIYIGEIKRLYGRYNPESISLSIIGRLFSAIFGPYLVMTILFNNEYNRFYFIVMVFLTILSVLCTFSKIGLNAVKRGSIFLRACSKS